MDITSIDLPTIIEQIKTFSVGNITTLVIIEWAGTFVFAMSGIRSASVKQYDWFGAFIVGFATATGGGTFRDLLLGATPFWLLNPSYMICTGLALLFAILFRRFLIPLRETFFLFDTIGLGLFVAAGIEKTLNLGYPLWVAVTMGTITGSFGGIVRDVLINDEPLIFRREIYAMTCVFGGLVFCLMFILNTDRILADAITGVSVIIARILCVRFKLSFPVLKNKSGRKQAAG